MAISDSNKAVASLTEWITRNQRWDELFQATMADHIEAALKRTQLTPPNLTSILGEHGTAVLFGCVFEDLTTRRFDEAPHNVVDDYLQRRGWRESVHCRRYMEALRGASISLYEVTNVLPGHWVEVRDMLRGGESIRVFENLGSREMVRWDRVGARVVDYLGKKVFTGAILPYTVERSDALLRHLETLIAERLVEGGWQQTSLEHPEFHAATDATLAAATMVFTSFWLAQQIDAHQTPPLQVVNAEGDRIEFTETRFSLREGAAAEVVARLDALDELRRQDGAPPTWDWVEAIGSKPAPRRKTAGIQYDIAKNDERVLGVLKLADGALQLSSHSMARMKRGSELLKAALGELIGVGLTGLTNLDDALERAHQTAPTERATGEVIPPEIAAKIMNQYFDQHYRDWITTPLPALNGRSPKQAVRSEQGRDEVVALLKYVENMDARRANRDEQPAYDLGWLWEELGLTARRR